MLRTGTRWNLASWVRTGERAWLRRDRRFVTGVPLLHFRCWSCVPCRIPWRTLVWMSSSNPLPPDTVDDRISHLHGRFPLGPLGRAIADGGGSTMSVDSSGVGVVLVSASSARAEPVLGPDEGSSVAGVAAIRARLANSGLVWWVLVAVIAVAAAAVAWFGPTTPAQPSSARDPVPDTTTPAEPVTEPPPTAAPPKQTPARAQRTKPKPKPKRSRPPRSRPAPMATPLQPAPVTPQTPSAPATSYTPPRARPRPQPAPPSAAGDGPAAELVPVH